MSEGNGHGQIEELVVAPPVGRITLDPELLNSRDMRRARTMLEGRNPYELLDDPIDRVPLIVWCLASRDNPDFTWDQALDIPFSRLQFGSDEPDPPTAPPGSPGPGAEPKPVSGSSKKQRAATPKPSSPPSTG